MDNETQKLNDLERQTSLSDFGSKTKKYLIFILIALLFTILDLLFTWQYSYLNLNFSIFDYPIVFSFLSAWLLFNIFYSRDYAESIVFFLIFLFIRFINDILLTGITTFKWSVSVWSVSDLIIFAWFLLIVILLNKLLRIKSFSNKIFNTNLFGFAIFLFISTFLLSLFANSYMNIFISMYIPMSFYDVIYITIKQSLIQALPSGLMLAPIFYYLLPKIKLIRINFLKTVE